MASRTQEETKQFFSNSGILWLNETAAAPNQYSVGNARSSFVLEWAKQQGAPLRFLDLGCGDGSLLLQLARSGHQAVGIDFSPELIKKAQASLQEGPPLEVEFIEASLMEINWGCDFDAVIAMGLMEYFSKEEWLEVLKRISVALKPTGSLLLHSRNRLFNLFSANEYTQQEASMGTLPSLLEETSFWRTAPAETFQNLPPPAQNLEDDFPASLTPLIQVGKRRQCTPLQVAEELRLSGLKLHRLRPCHFHPAPPSCEAWVFEEKQSAALKLESLQAPSLLLLPQCSSVLIEALKPAA